MQPEKHKYKVQCSHTDEFWILLLKIIGKYHGQCRHSLELT